MALFDLTGKTTVITGGGSGIGKSISLLFAKQGASVHILELNKENGEETVNIIKKEGGKAACYPCNVSQQADVIGVFDSIYKAAGKIDILVNNAGIAHIGNIEKVTEADLDKIYNVNIKGVYNCSYAAIDKMQKQGGGVILNMASIASVAGVADRFAYSMSKGAAFAMTLSIAQDYVKKNIRCNCISPARVHTPFVDNFLKNNYPGQEKEMFEKLSKSAPIGRMAKPDEVASLALFLCSDEAGFITGCNYPIDGGFITLK